MMATERATTPVSAAPCSEQNNPPESTTDCAYCPEGVLVYQIGDGQWICQGHVGMVISLAANDLWPDMVSYTREFENVLMC